MARYFIFISYKGTYYHGWQVQPNSVTVQKILDESLTLVLGEKIKTTVQEELIQEFMQWCFVLILTDSSMDLEKDKNLVSRLNSFLPSRHFCFGYKKSFDLMQMQDTVQFQGLISISFPVRRIPSVMIQAGTFMGISTLN